MRKIILLWVCLFLGLTPLLAQERTVSGTVSSEDEGPLPGVSVLVKGTTTGTVTDVNGKYRITLPGETGTLVFSSVSYTTEEVIVGNRSTIDLVMVQDIKSLSEVIVTAVGIEREKKALGYAVTEIEGNAISQKSEPDIARALNGKVAGVTVQGAGGAIGGNTNIIIRGNSSLTGNNQPLYVVDGVPFDNSTLGFDPASGNTVTNRAFDLDPNNIESMTVLKGAAAAALYGSRAQNGAIIITTKANSSATKKGLEVTYNASFGLEEVASIPDYQTTYGQGGNGNVYIEQYFGSFGAPYTAYDSVPHPYTNPGLGPLLQSPSYQAVATRGDNVAYEPHTDKYRNYFQTGSLLEQAINIRSGGATTNLSAGISWTKNQGIIPNSKINRYTANFGGNAQLENGLFLSGAINYVKTAKENPAMGSANFGGSNQSASQLALWMPTSFNAEAYPYQREEDGGAMYYRTVNSPYWVADNSQDDSEVDRVYGNLKLGYDIKEWLTISYQLGFNAYTDRRQFIIQPGGFGSAIEQSGIIRNSNYYRAELDGNLLISTDNAIGTDFNLRTITGWNFNQRTQQQEIVEGNGIIERGINTLNNTSAQFVVDDRFIQRRFTGIFTDISLSFRDYAFLNVTARNDWSSTLPEDNRSYFYPGVSTSLIFTDAFDLNGGLLSFGKIRAGIAQVGNDAEPYLTSSNFLVNQAVSGSSTQFPFTNQFGTINGSTLNDNRGNPLLKPELTTEWEIGTDLQFLNGLIGVDFTYYNRTTRNGITQINVPPSSGSATQVVNIGKVRNRGIELGLDITPISTGAFNWNMYAAFTRNRNEVLELAPGVDQIVLTQSAGSSEIVQIAHRNGQPYGVLIGREAIRDADGDLLIDGLPGQTYGKYLDNPDPQVIGDPNPDFTLGLTNTISYKGIQFSFLFDWVQGGDLYSKSNREIVGRGLTDDTGDRMVSRIMPGYIAQRNPDGSLARDEAGNYLAATDAEGNKIRNTVNISNFNWWYNRGGFGWNAAEEFHTFDATVIRLREVALNYSLPATILESTPFGSATIGFSGRNLWFEAPGFHDGLNLDPETSSFAGQRGIDFIGVPSTRRYSVNVSLTF
ncbi:SusC/RagA family TonB-linked outer membrane protein [Catalinimonas sp. 4WD22]|uniref:SusC/RagA family TonB-linked outer membrane protein n=1 Tax=Catalinimonas locisalis TaxID=3133978 RepID=UPI0031012521